MSTCLNPFLFQVSSFDLQNKIGVAVHYEES